MAFYFLLHVILYLLFQILPTLLPCVLTWFPTTLSSYILCPWCTVSNSPSHNSTVIIPAPSSPWLLPFLLSSSLPSFIHIEKPKLSITLQPLWSTKILRLPYIISHNLYNYVKELSFGSSNSPPTMSKYFQTRACVLYFFYISYNVVGISVHTYL